MSNELIIGVMTIAGSIVGAVVVALLNRKKTKADTQKTMQSMYVEMIEEFREEREEHRKIIKELKLSNEECEYKHDVAELEMQQLKKQINFQNWSKEKVFILDDNKNVITSFRKKFANISSIDYQAFINNDEFLEATTEHRPEILILDYFLGDLTADDIIERIGYEPEVFIMSGDSSIRIKYKDTPMKFFDKDGQLLYISKIAKAVLQHIKEKHK